MSDITDTGDIVAGNPAPLVRLFGWGMLAILAGYFFDNILTLGFGFPTVGGIANGEASAWVLVLVYVVVFAIAAFFVMRSPERALRKDAKTVSDFNAYLVRGCFFAVLFVGFADATIAFLRVEGLLESLFPEALAKNLIRAKWVGPTIHFPLILLGFVAALFSRTLGFIWLALLIVLAELLIVFTRFVFSYEQALIGDLVRYWYAALFLFASAYTLLEDGHVRVDVFYAGFSQRRKGRTNAVGTILLGMTTCWVIILIGMNGKQSIINSPIANFEISQTSTAGMFIKYQMAAFLAIFAITMLIQFVSFFFEAIADARNEPGKREAAPVAH